MKKEEREKLRELAKRATQGLWAHKVTREGSNLFAVVEPADWRESACVATCGVYDANNDKSREKAGRNKNAAYIAAARPEKILELLEQIEELENALKGKCETCPWGQRDFQ